MIDEIELESQKLKWSLTADSKVYVPTSDISPYDPNLWEKDKKEEKNDQSQHNHWDEV